MISPGDVIRMKVPYPNISAGLAVSAHMYICREAEGDNYEYIKCQTLKPKMLGSSLFRHFVDEAPDISRNPFQRTTRIDCDKVFTTNSFCYDDGMKTTARPDVCSELFSKILKELEADGYEEIKMNVDELTGLNPKIAKIQR